MKFSKRPVAKALIAIGVVSGVVGSAHAGRVPTPEEATKVKAALASIGCSGGRIEADDGGFEVEGATCDGQGGYEIELSGSYQLLKRERDD